jgi:hypothetical protein
MSNYPELIIGHDNTTDKTHFIIARTIKKIDPDNGEFVTEDNIVNEFVGDNSLASTFVAIGIIRRNYKNDYQSVLLHNKNVEPNFYKNK